MQAYYYAIKHKIDDEIVDEGIIRNSEDTIYPRQNTGIEELPHQCEVHHFSAPNHKIEGFYIELSRSDVRQKRSSDTFN